MRANCAFCGKFFSKKYNEKMCSDECRRLRINSQVAKYEYANRDKKAAYNKKYQSERYKNDLEFRAKKYRQNKEWYNKHK